MKLVIAVLLLAASTAHADRKVEIPKLVIESKPLFTRCYNLALEKQPFLDVHTVTVSVELDKPGNVVAVGLVGIPTDDGGYARCLRGVIRRWHVSAGDPMTVEFTLP